MFDIETGYRKSKFWRLRNNARLQPQAPQWPLARLGDREPLVLAEHSETRRGIDLGYAPSALDSELFVPVHAVQLRSMLPPGTRSRSTTVTGR